jgi:hypothetical protein
MVYRSPCLVVFLCAVVLVACATDIDDEDEAVRESAQLAEASRDAARRACFANLGAYKMATRAESPRSPYYTLCLSEEMGVRCGSNGALIEVESCGSSWSCAGRGVRPTSAASGRICRFSRTVRTPGL